MVLAVRGGGTLTGAWCSVFGFAFAILSAFAGKASASDLGELQDRFRESKSCIEQLSLSARAEFTRPVFTDAGMKTPETAVALIESRACASGMFWQSETSYPERPLGPRRIIQFRIHADGSILSAQVNLDEDGKSVYPNDDGVGLLLSDRSIVDPDSRLRTKADLYAGAPYIGLLYGWLPGGTLDSFFATVDAVEKSESDSNITYVCGGSRGSLEVVFAGEPRKFPSSVRLMRGPGDRFGDGGPTKDSVLEQMRRFPGYSPSESDSDWTVEEFSCQWVFGDLVQSRSGQVYPSSIRWNELTKFKKSATEERKAVVTVVENPLHEAGDCDFTFDIPMNADVTVQGGPQLAYHWDGEKAVPSVPILGEGSRSFGGRSGLIWLLTVNVVLGFIAVVYFLLQKRRTR